MGTAAEHIVASGTVDLADLVFGMTRQVMLNLLPGGLLDLRVKALDFGLPAPLDAPPETESMVLVRLHGPTYTSAACALPTY